jgi:hypothetical protein
VTDTSSTEVLKWREANRAIADDVSEVEAIQVNSGQFVAAVAARQI